MASWGIGIDLGTCLSSVAILEDGKPVAIDIATATSNLIGDSYCIPSSVYIEEDGTIFLGQKADNNRLKNPTRYKKEFKRELGITEPYHMGEAVEIFPEDLYREFFKYFKSKAEERLSGKVENVVITHPANFAGYKKELIKKAGEMSGFSKVELLDEPTAAAIYYASREKVKEGSKILVYDLGGGTFDVSLIVKEGDGFRALTPPLGIERCGGVDFQRKIYEDILDTLREAVTPILSKRDKTTRQFCLMVEGEAIKAKHNLSFDAKVEVSIMMGYLEYLTYEITRSKFEGMLSEYIDQTCRKIDEIVKNAGIKMNDIDRVLMVGGSSKIPYIQEMVKKVTGQVIYKDVNTELVVAYGAAIWANRNNKSSSSKNEAYSKKQDMKQVEVENVNWAPSLIGEKLNSNSSQNQSSPNKEKELKDESGSFEEMFNNSIKDEETSHDSNSSYAKPKNEKDNKATSIKERKVVVVNKYGAGDCKSISEGIKMVASGGRVVVHEGIYEESVNINKEVDIEAWGAIEKTIIRSSKGSCLKIDSDRVLVSGIELECKAGKNGVSAVGVDIGGGNVTLTRCKISSDSLSNVAIHGKRADVNIKDCKIFNGKQAGIFIHEGAKAKIESSEVYGNKYSGIEVKEKSSVIIRDCTVSNNSYHGIWVFEESTVTIDNCKIFNNLMEGVCNQGVNVKITGCSIYSNGLENTGVGEDKKQANNKKEQIILVRKDGAGNYKSIQDAVNKATNGAQIIVGEGTYLESLNINKNVEIKASGACDKTIIRSAKDTCVTVTSERASITGFTIECKIYSTEVEGFGVIISKGNITLSKCKVTSNSLSGVIINENAREVTIEKSIIYDCKQAGIAVFNNAKVSIEECNVYNNEHSAIYLKGEGSETVAKRCEMYGCKNYGVWLLETSKAIIDNCNIYNNEYSGISISDKGNGQIKNSKIYNNKKAGIVTFDTGKVNVDGCNIYNNGSLSAQVSESSEAVIKNSILKGSEAGIINNSKLTIEKSEISDNAKCGMQFNENSTSIVKYCKVFNNTNDGIWFREKSMGTVENCDIYDNKMEGICNEGVNVKIVGCKLYGNGSGNSLNQMKPNNNANTGKVIVVNKNGTGDCTTIQAAVNKAENGTTIKVDEGFYNEEIVVSKNIDIVATGSLDKTTISTGGCNIGVTFKAERASIKGFKIENITLFKFLRGEGCGVSVERGNVRIFNCKITSDTLSGMVVNGENTEVAIEQCDIYDCKQAGIAVFGTAKVTIDRCNIYNSKLSGVQMSKNSKVVIKNSVIRGNDVGVYCKEKGNLLIEKCDVNGNNKSGIESKEDTTFAIRRCKVFGNKCDGIWIHEKATGTIDGCEILDNTLKGICNEGVNVKIIGCKLTGNGTN